VTQLVDALERFGHDVEGEAPDDPSHPIVISALDMYALRRTPPTQYTPYADDPPVLRVPYVWFFDTSARFELAVVMLIGDKTTLGHLWYPAQVELIESRLAPEWARANPDHRAIGRRR
jgi:hypothetical protein